MLRSAKTNSLKESSAVRFALGLILAAFPLMSAQGQAPNVNILGGNVTLTVSTGLAGSEPLAVLNSATTLRYRRLGYVQKVTVQTRCPGQNFNLVVAASSATSGIPAPQVVLTDGMPAVDFITSIATGRGFATATLNYVASSTFAQGNSLELGDDVHTVTYTITAQ